MRNNQSKGLPVLLLAFTLVSAPVFGQDARTSFGKKSGHAESCKQDENTKECETKAAKSPVTEEASRFPNAARVAPEFPKTKIKKQWDALVKASTAKDSTALIAAAEAVLNHSDASVNEKSEAANQIVQANLGMDRTSYAKPIEYGKKAIELNGLNNNSHYQLMGALGQMLLAEKQYPEALQYINRYAAETGIDDLMVNKTRGNALYRMGKYPEASVALKKAYDLDKGADANLAVMLMDSYSRSGKKAEAAKIADDVAKSVPATDPNDTGAQVKQLLVLANARQYEKAAKVFDELYAKGQISQVKEYEAGYVSYSHLDGREAQAIKIINDGIAKGVIKPDADVYGILGQSYYYTDNPKGAIDAWGKGAALAKTGDQYLLQARVLGEESEYTRSKAAAQQALSKGIENKGDAYLIIAEAESEFGLDNRTAMIAALKEAAKYPESQTQANKLLKQAGAK